jgi:hypothetical protein
MLKMQVMREGNPLGEGGGGGSLKRRALHPREAQYFFFFVTFVRGRARLYTYIYVIRYIRYGGTYKINTGTN